MAGVLAAGGTVGWTLLQRTRAEKSFWSAHRHVLVSIADLNKSISGALTTFTGGQPDVIPLQKVVADSTAMLERVELPVGPSRFADRRTRLGESLDAETSFVVALATSIDKPAQFTQAGIDALKTNWERTLRALDRASRDNPTFSSSKEEMSQVLDAFGKRYLGVADKARSAGALTDLDTYHRATLAVLNRYEVLRDALGSYKGSSHRITNSQQYDEFKQTFEAAAQGRYALAEELEALMPAAPLASLHQSLASTVRTLGDEVRKAAQAADAAYCYSSTDPAQCPTVGQTQGYKDYQKVANALYNQFASLKVRWEQAYASERARLGKAAA